MIWYIAAVALLAITALLAWRELQATRERTRQLTVELTRSEELHAQMATALKRLNAAIDALQAKEGSP